MTIKHRAQAGLPIRVGNRELRGVIQIYEGAARADVYAVLTVGGPFTPADCPLVRLHSGCVTGDVLGSCRCECGEQLAFAFARIGEVRSGIVIYVPSHEGRGIGLLNKIRAYALQDHGLDTIEANCMLGFPVDSRDYCEAAEILLDLGVKSVRLLSNNPIKIAHLEASGIQVERVEMPSFRNAHNGSYIDVKAAKLGHFIAKDG